MGTEVEISGTPSTEPTTHSPGQRTKIMETATMGRVLTEATIENIGDLWDLEKGRIQPDQVRRITVSSALVDTGATSLALQSHLIKQLGLTKRYSKHATTAMGNGEVDVYGTARLTVQGRDCSIDVTELPDGLKELALIGQIPLEIMDYVVDPKGQRLIGNPRHDGEWVLDL